MGAYLRGEGGIHGGCAALDIGAGSIRAAIYLQNRTTPERSANIPYGTQMTLYETYANHPERIEYDFGGCSMGSLSLAKDALTARSPLLRIRRRTSANVHDARPPAD